uniref:Cytochrome P450 n=1 Tax=Kalanchoe fedtschenkoi TaxID=63787 RepID=A0A7N0TPV0_KALFE
MKSSTLQRQVMHFFIPLGFAVFILAKLIHSHIWVPRKIQLHFRKQGIEGPEHRPIVGNSLDIRDLSARALSKPMLLSHDILSRVVPFYHTTSALYGKNFLFWFGNKPRLAVYDKDIIKDALLNTNGAIERTKVNPSAKVLLGDGLIALAGGEKWALHRRMANQAFKSNWGWIPEIVASTDQMLEKWETERGGKEEFELEVSKEVHLLTADILSRTAFGSSFEEGKQIFENQEKLMALTSLAFRSIYIPGFRFLPTRKNLERWRLEKKVHESIRRLMEMNGKREENSRNLLSLMMSTYKNQDGKEERLRPDEVIDECKTFYVAGKETSGNFMSWALLCLAMHPEWQIKAREEVTRVLKNNKAPTAEDLNELKTIMLITNETLRLYPPIVMLTRETTRDIRLGKIDVLAGTELFLSQIAVHRDPEIWGSDANDFNPSRFNEPKKHLASSFPFGLGPRFCVGQSLALVEAKVGLAMIIKNYSFEVSPTYVHAPMHLMTLRPQYGVQLRFRKIPS